MKTDHCRKNSDLVLAEEVERGSKEAADQLCKRYYDQLVGWLNSRIPAHHRRRYDGEDVAPLVLMVVIKRLENDPAKIVGEDGSVRAFLYGVARRKLSEARRQHEVDCRSVSREGEWDETMIAGKDNTDCSETTQQVRELMESLDERERSVCVSLQAGATHAEIAGELGIHERTVRKMIARIRERWSLAAAC